VRRALALYLRLIRIQWRSQLQYRAAFTLDLLGGGLSTIVWFAGIALIFERFDRLGGWTLGEVAFLYGMAETGLALALLLFNGFDPGDFGQYVRRGTFDQFLLRPLSLTVQVLGSRISVARIGRILQAAIILALALSWTDIHWTAAKLLYMPAIIAGLVCFFSGLFVIGSTITFWTVESVEVINIFTYGGSELMSYPMHIYQAWMRDFFTYIVPAIFLNYYPALFILDRPDPLGFPSWAPFLAPLAGLGVFAAAQWFWRYGIRHYQSTGS